MQSNTRVCFNRYMGQVAAANNLSTVVGEAFNYSPEAQQAFYGAVGEKADMLSRINQISVTAQLGQKIGLGVGRPIASRTNTEDHERQTNFVGKQEADDYFCKQTNYDHHLPYRLVDSWAHLTDFAAIYSGQIIKQVARDTLMVGWNGESAAAETDLIANPLLQDVNEGWLTKVRKKQPHRIMGYGSDGNANTDSYTVGTGGEYSTLDALVFDMTVSLLDSWHQNADDLVVMVGREIWVAHGLALLANSTLPTERNALQTWFASKTVAGLPCIMPPFLPSRAVVVTSYDNLSIYHQMSSLRRTVVDNAKRDRVEEYLSENVAYVVEDFGKFAAVRHGAIQLPDGEDGWA